MIVKKIKRYTNIFRFQKNVNEEEKIAYQISESSDLAPFDEFANGLCSWKPKLEKFIQTKKWKQIYDFIKPEYQSKTIYPPANLIFNAFYLTSLKNLKVVKSKNLKSQSTEIQQLGKKLFFIYSILRAKQGIFMINDILTVEAEKPTSHKKAGWAEFTDEVIKIINNECLNIIFLLWGEPAQKKAKMVNLNKHYVLKACHPSPLSASKGGFFTCGHFSKVNEILAKIGKETINWNLPE